MTLPQRTVLSRLRSGGLGRLAVLCLALAASVSLSHAAAGVCAQVKLRLEQSAFLTRTGYAATLEISNESPTLIDEVSVAIVIKTADGQVATSRFGILPPTLNVLTGVTGQGSLAPGALGTAKWLIVPATEAAPLEPTRYLIGGQFSYRFQGQTITEQFEDVAVTVHPDAQLTLQYFHQNFARGDDPWTDTVVEPSKPYALALLVKNDGGGTARNFRIVAAQPQIVDNQKGLFVAFRLVSATVDGQPADPTLMLNVGDIAPGQRKQAIWYLESTLDGVFKDLKASLEYVTVLGDARLSAVKAVEIHSLVQLVEAGGAADDGAPDFLVDDQPDPFTTEATYFVKPDRLYLSNGQNFPVELAISPVVAGSVTPANPVTTLTVSGQTGWIYSRVPDPSGGTMVLQRVQRQDGREIPVGKNAWQTDRTFIGERLRPRYEKMLHLLDDTGSATYTLTFGTEGADTEAPTSSVAALPATSFHFIPVTWSGTDNVGITGYDIFVARDNGFPTLWLTNTRDNGAVYDGVPGSRYAFYSVAVDAAGNREVAPLVPDATTVAQAANFAPRFLRVGGQTVVAGSPVQVSVAAGAELRLALEAEDPDGDARLLQFDLDPIAASPGAAIDVQSSARLAVWKTAEGDANRTVAATFRVRDAGAPPLTDSVHVVITVTKSGLPPVFDTLANWTGKPGQTFATNVRAVDPDGKTVTYALGDGAPAGVTLNASSGHLTWTPTTVQIGTYAIPIRASDGIDTAETVLTASIRPESALERWAATEGLSDALPATLLRDADGDGVISFLEYALLTKPLTGDRPEMTSEMWLLSGSPRASLLARVRSSDPDLLVTAEWSANLTIWAALAATVRTTVSDGIEQLRFVVPTELEPGKPHFVRLKVALVDGSIVRTGEVYTVFPHDLGAVAGTTRYVPLQLAAAVEGTGTVNQLAGTDVGLAEAAWAEGQFTAKPEEAYFAEVTSGVAKGRRAPIVVSRRSALVLQAAIPGLALGDTVVVRRSPTLGEKLRAASFTGFRAAGNPSAADNFIEWDAKAQRGSRYFLSDVNGFPGWHDALYAEAGTRSLAGTVALISAKRNDGVTRLYETGVVNPVAARIALEPGLNLAKPGKVAASVTLNELGLVSAGFKAATTMDESDQVILVKTDGRVKTFWRSSATVGWFDETNVSADATLIQPGEAFFVRRTGVTGLEWIVPTDSP